MTPVSRMMRPANSTSRRYGWPPGWPRDPAALATGLREILVAPELQRQMGRHNRAMVEAKYAWARVIDRLEDVYREAIATPRSFAKRLKPR